MLNLLSTINNFARQTLGRVTTETPFAFTAAGLINTTTGTIAGYINASGQLILTSSGQATYSTISVTDTTTPSISLAAGSTNTGTITINGKTSGSLILTTADATGQAITIKPAAQTSGAVTLTTPDFAGVNDTFAFITKAQTFVNKTLTAPVINGCTAASGNIDFSGSSGTTKTTTGTFTISGRRLYTTVNTPVAATGSTNSDAAALTTATRQHVTSDSAAKGWKLPVGVAGDRIEIINDSATAGELYPDTGGNVNGQTTTTGSVTIPASKGVVAHCDVALTWIVFEMPAKAS